MALALSLGLVAALAAPAGAATGDSDAVSRAGTQSLFIWAYFDGDTPVSGGRVRVYAGGRRLREGGAGTARTLSEGTALLRFRSLPPRLRVVVSGGRAGGRPVRGSLKAKVRGVTDGELVDVNPVTTVSDVWAHAEEGRSHRRARNLIERTLGIRRILDDYDLYATDRWFDGDRFHRWTLEQGSVGAGARALVQHVERPGFDRRVFRPRDDGSGARIAVDFDPEAGGNVLLDALLGGISDAADKVGLRGSVYGLALDVLKAGFTSGGGKDDVSTALKELAGQVAELKVQLGKAIFDLQVDKTEDVITKIQAAEKKLAFTLSQPDTAEGRRTFTTAKAEFIDLAHDLAKSSADDLNKALTDVQVGGTAQNPVRKPALLPAYRSQIAQRFFTSEGSGRIDRFYSYYEWAQTRLATVLTTYYMLGGPCAWTAPPGDCVFTPPRPDPKADPEPDPGSAEHAVNEIKDNLTVQRQFLPAKSLNTEPLRGKVFIDIKSGPLNSMWRVDPTYRSSAKITLDGTFSGCIGRPWPTLRETCRLDAFACLPKGRTRSGCVGPEAYDFRAPDLFETKRLFAEHTGTALSWLKTLGVSFDDPTAGRDYDPNKLRYSIALWLRDQWARGPLQAPGIGSGQELSATSIGATLLALEKRSPNTVPKIYAYKEPYEDGLEVASGCPIVQHALQAVPSCAKPDESTGGFILWVHAMTAQERQRLCGSGWDNLPVRNGRPVLTLPAHNPGDKPTEVLGPPSVPQLC